VFFNRALAKWATRSAHSTARRRTVSTWHCRSGSGYMLPLEFKGEAFNRSTRRAFRGDMDINSTTFGRITSVNVGSRVVQCRSASSSNPQQTGTPPGVLGPDSQRRFRPVALNSRQFRVRPNSATFPPPCECAYLVTGERRRNWGQTSSSCGVAATTVVSAGGLRVVTRGT
jgi:hypothetical protein